MKRARVSRPRRSPLLPLLQGGIGCVVLAILQKNIPGMIVSLIIREGIIDFILGAGGVSK